MADKENHNQLHEEVKDNIGEMVSFDLTNKKKKKKKKPFVQDLAEEESVDSLVQRTENSSDRDFEYEELLGRVFNILRKNNPELARNGRRMMIMRRPKVLEVNKKSVFVNFMNLCRTMHRQPEHVMAFLFSEMGTSGSLDGQQRLVVKGIFTRESFQGVLRRYMSEYVICNGCKNPDTILAKEEHLFFIRCDKCGSGRSVAPIRAGFVAHVGRRREAGT